MKPRTLYSLWITAFLLKSIGAAWDASFHFKYLRELTQAPHVVNIIGNILAILIFIKMWKEESGRLTKPLKIIALGILVFIFGIFFDDWWHRMFGIDLTTWSLAHFILYIGTALVIVGVLAKSHRDYQRGFISATERKVIQLFLIAFLFEAFWFPLLQQEEGVVAYFLFEQGRPLASKEVLELVKNPTLQVYGGLPLWLYAVWSSFSAILFFRFLKYFSFSNFSATIVASMYVAFRATMNCIFAYFTYPTSTVPYFLILAGITFDLTFFYRTDENS